MSNNTAPTLLVLALATLGALSGCARRPGRATTPTRVTMVSDEWTLWSPPAAAATPAPSAGAPTPCPSPCEVESSGGEVVVLASEGGAAAPQHRAIFPVDGPLEIRVGRWSHAGERTAGGALLAVGWGLGAAAGITFSALALAWDDGVSAAFGWVSCALLGIIFSIPGGILLDADDHPTYDLENERPRAREARRRARRAGADLLLAPLVAPSDTGLSVGVAGAF